MEIKSGLADDDSQKFYILLCLWLQFLFLFYVLSIWRRSFVVDEILDTKKLKHHQWQYPETISEATKPQVRS